VFAWTQSTQVSLILGQINFFMEFDICFYPSQLYFSVSQKIQNTEIQLLLMIPFWIRAVFTKDILRLALILLNILDRHQQSIQHYCIATIG
jgi:flagellar assembly factor FliW